MLFHAAALIAFFGAFHISELMARSRSDTSGAALLKEDVAVHGGQIRIVLRWSKTDQRQKGTHVMLCTSADRDLCPVSALSECLVLRGDDKGFLLRHRDSSPLTKHQFWTVTSKALEAIGLARQRFCTHSFRIGAASIAAAMGYWEQEIRRIGHWHSKAFASYVWPTSKISCWF